ncbi:hypothetical protein P1X15_02610 [Runella sp. MFBS21]|uniref:hypothetical protein n=1 Tax=Runella sp. MFBS21 TaxID=3034018 RepID=UPI0023F880C5|nr:hypothetical protein [Runella sp. MFBS21]MDF7816462.1 hypothetical protein [Runella sp. MFBS21]
MNRFVYTTLLQEMQELLSEVESGTSSTKRDLIHDNIYADTLTQLAKNYAATQWRSLSYLWTRYEKGLAEARNGQFQVSQRIFDEVQHYRHHTPTDLSLFPYLVEVSALPAIAYLRYKQKNYAEAETMLVSAIGNDALLTAQGFYILEYHRIQQLHNLARLYFSQQRLEEAAGVIGQALRFMVYGHIPTLGDQWAENYLRQAPVQLRSDMLLQLSSETVSIFLNYLSTERELFEIAFKNLTFWEPATPDERAMLEWFELKEAFYAPEVSEDILQRTVSFFKNQPTHFDIYKLALLVELTKHLSQGGFYDTHWQSTAEQFVNKLKVSSRQRASCVLFFKNALAPSEELASV